MGVTHALSLTLECSNSGFVDLDTFQLDSEKKEGAKENECRDLDAIC